MKALTVEIAAPGPDPVLAPVGIATPHDAVTACMVTGGQIMQVLNEPELGLSACLIEPGEGPLFMRYVVEPAPKGQPYPEAAFRTTASP